MTEAGIPEVVRDALFLPHGIVSAEAVRPGLSGARIFRCCGGNQTYALRRWPPGTDAERVGEVHRVTCHARDAGCELVPQRFKPSRPGRPSGVILNNGLIWELCEWVDGRPLEIDADDEHIAAGATAIANFHRATRGLGEIVQPAPAVTARRERLRVLRPLVSRAIQAVEAEPSRIPSELRRGVERLTDRLRVGWPAAADQIGSQMAVWGGTPVPTQYVLRDIHRDHLLFNQSEPKGLIDFDAIRVDTPVTDLARWVSSFGASDTARWEVAMAGFRVNSPSQQGISVDQARSLALSLAFATTWISLANWLVWLALERRDFEAGPDAVTGRIRELLRSVEAQGMTE